MIPASPSTSLRSSSSPVPDERKTRSRPPARARSSLLHLSANLVINRGNERHTHRFRECVRTVTDAVGATPAYLRSMSNAKFVLSLSLASTLGLGAVFGLGACGKKDEAPTAEQRDKALAMSTAWADKLCSCDGDGACQNDADKLYEDMFAYLTTEEGKTVNLDEDVFMDEFTRGAGCAIDQGVEVPGL